MRALKSHWKCAAASKKFGTSRLALATTLKLYFVVR